MFALVSPWISHLILSLLLLRVVQMCTHLPPTPIQVSVVTQSPCWLSLLCWHWSALLEEKVASYWVDSLCAVCASSSIVTDLHLHCCVLWEMSSEGEGDSEAGGLWAFLPDNVSGTSGEHQCNMGVLLLGLFLYIVLLYNYLFILITLGSVSTFWYRQH